jgi:hypothetical protein
MEALVIIFVIIWMKGQVVVACDAYYRLMTELPEEFCKVLDLCRFSSVAEVAPVN